ncbi:hypothetical protein DH2020_041593 [Rehmannia glutinosa]|uniref:Uncharacterized protein n=1 Tax=Rehmannia glutinosa TaxID=99300 RepID=A0ABR0UQD2_REHGL
MVALFSPQICSLGWILEDPISYEQENLNYLCGGKTEISEYSIDIHSPSSVKTQPQNGEFGSYNDGFYNGDDNKTMKKLNHNASERDRRKKSTACILLLGPFFQQRIILVLKYIPELQQEIERLIKKKESLTSSKISPKVEQDHSPLIDLNNKRIKSNTQSSSLSVVSATPISDREIVIQISMSKAEKRALLSEAVMSLEQDGFLTLSATCFESFDGRVFYNLHLQAQGNQVLMDAEMLKEKVWLN